MSSFFSLLSSRPPHFAPGMMPGDPNSSGGFIPGQANMPPLPHMQQHVSSASGGPDGGMGGMDANSFVPSSSVVGSGPLTSSPMSEGAGVSCALSASQVKQEPSEDSASAGEWDVNIGFSYQRNLFVSLWPSARYFYPSLSPCLLLPYHFLHFDPLHICFSLNDLNI